MRLTLNEIAEYCGGKVFGDGEITVDGFFTDSRQAEPGKMFIPIKGERVDGHKFIPSVFAAGCKAAFTEEEPACNGSFVFVNDSVAALQAVAERYRQKFSIPLIGITGSVGKTTTKEMVALAIEDKIKVHKTAGNANSQIGVPQTVLGISEDDRAAVIELGMSLPGEMEKIVRIARPNIGIITNIGVSHIEFHGTREKILEQKLHIADYIDEDGILFVNGDDDLLKDLKGKLRCKVVTFGIGENCDHRAFDIKQAGMVTKFIYDRGDKQFFVAVPALGDHNVRNALVALAVAKHIGFSTCEAIDSIAGYTPPEMRQQIKSFSGITVIDDTYNASPDSMIGAVDILSKAKGRKIAVLADMLELGDYSPKGHRDVGEYAKAKEIDYLIAVGNEAKYIFEGFDDSKHSSLYSNNDDACKKLSELLRDGDTVLVKGSRGMKTDKIVDYISKIRL